MDNKAIATGGILSAMCLLLCVFGVWGWMHTVHEHGWMSGSGKRTEKITQDNLVETMQGSYHGSVINIMFPMCRNFWILLTRSVQAVELCRLM